MAIVKLSDQYFKLLYKPMEAYFNSVQVVQENGGKNILRVQGHGAPSDDTEISLAVLNQMGTDIYIIHSWITKKV